MLMDGGVGEGEAELEGGTAAAETGHAWHVNSESESESDTDTDRGHGVNVDAVMVVVAAVPGTAMDKLMKTRLKMMMSVGVVAAEQDMGVEPSAEQTEGRDSDRWWWW